MQQYHADPNAVLLDVRTHTEYQEQHLPNALQIDIKQDSFVDELNELNNTLNYYVYCRIGIRSANACGLYRQFVQFKRRYHSIAKRVLIHIIIALY